MTTQPSFVSRTVDDTVVAAEGEDEAGEDVDEDEARTLLLDEARR
jgi:hypothetical protein